MVGKIAQRREALRTRLIDIAETTIAADGLDAVKARDLAKQADCAVGAIYNVFTDLNNLIIAVNGRTFRKLGQHVQQALINQPSDNPTDTLITLSKGYLDFAATQPKLWRALFDLEMSTDSDVPEWYLQELQTLFAHIAKPLGELFPNKPPADIALMTRALFSSVHGIVLLGLERRISGVPTDQIEHMIELILRNVTSQSIS